MEFKDGANDNGNNNDNGNDKEPEKYDPRCGMSKEEFEWRWAHYERVRQRMPQALDELSAELERMRRHFLTDPDALQKWDSYQKNVLEAFSRNLLPSFSSPVHAPSSVLYEHLMKREAHSRTFGAMVSGRVEKLKQATGKLPKKMLVVGAIVASVGAGFVLGFAAGPTLRKQHTWTNS